MFISPAKEKLKITSGYKTSDRPNHSGVDFVLESGNSYGAELVAIFTGTVVTKTDKFGGVYIDLTSVDKKYKARYLHVKARLHQDNTLLQANQKIAEMGFTGNVIPKNIRGTHLHFELFLNKSGTWINVNPLDYLNLTTNNNMNIINNKTKAIEIIKSQDFDKNTEEQLIHAVNKDSFAYILSYGGSEVRKVLNNEIDKLKKELDSIKQSNIPLETAKQTNLLEIEAKDKEIEKLKLNLVASETNLDSLELRNTELLKQVESLSLELDSKSIELKNLAKKKDTIKLINSSTKTIFQSKKFWVTFIGLAATIFNSLNLDTNAVDSFNNLILAVSAILTPLGVTGVYNIWQSSIDKKEIERQANI